jgi:hypothetical protein
MKNWMMIVVLGLVAAVAMAEPVVTVSEGRLTTAGVELLVIEGSGGTVITAVQGVELIMGEPGYGQFFGDTVLDLSPGDYTVRAWGPIPAEGPPRPDASFAFTVLAPDRLEQIRMAWARMSAAVAARRAAETEHAAAVAGWRGLAPTIVEIVATQQAQPAPTPARPGE